MLVFIELHKCHKVELYFKKNQTWMSTNHPGKTEIPPISFPEEAHLPHLTK